MMVWLPRQRRSWLLRYLRFQTESRAAEHRHKSVDRLTRIVASPVCGLHLGYVNPIVLHPKRAIGDCVAT